MNNCYNCKNLTIVRFEDYKGYEIWCKTECPYCDMRIKNHARACDKHIVGDPKIIYHKVK